MKKKKAAINPQNKDDKCFQYAVTVALNSGEIESHPERISKFERFLNKPNYKGTNYPLNVVSRRAFEKNNTTNPPNISSFKEKEISPAYIWKINSNCEKQNFY